MRSRRLKNTALHLVHEQSYPKLQHVEPLLEFDSQAFQSFQGLGKADEKKERKKKKRLSCRKVDCSYLYVKIETCNINTNTNNNNIFLYSQSPLPQTSAYRLCHLCAPHWETCPGTRCPCGNESYHCAAGAPPACPCRHLPVWGGVPGGGGSPGSPWELHASWVFPSNTIPLPAHHVLLWPPLSPPSRVSKAGKAAANHLLKREGASLYI